MKAKYLDYAEIFDSWRVVPRSVLFGYCWWVAHVTDRTLDWYMHLPATERTLESSGLAGAIITAITGMSVWVFKVYSDNGRDWTARPTEDPK